MKVYLGGMSILSILLSLGLGCQNHQLVKEGNKDVYWFKHLSILPYVQCKNMWALMSPGSSNMELITAWWQLMMFHVFLFVLVFILLSSPHALVWDTFYSPLEGWGGSLYSLIFSRLNYIRVDISSESPESSPRTRWSSLLYALSYRSCPRSHAPDPIRAPLIKDHMHMCCSMSHPF
jgi:hypothetical protein